MYQVLVFSPGILNQEKFMEIPSNNVKPQDVVFDLTTKKLNQLGNQASTSEAKTAEEIEKVAREFESLFVQRLLESMRKMVPKSGLFDSYANDMYESMLFEEVAKETSKEKGMGLADMINKDLNRLNEKILQAKGKIQISPTNLTSSVKEKGE